MVKQEFENKIDITRSRCLMLGRVRARSTFLEKGYARLTDLLRAPRDSVYSVSSKKVNKSATIHTFL